MKRIALISAALALVAGAAFWFLTAPRPLEPTRLAAINVLNGDAERGEAVFWISGCASCHAAPGARDAERLVLSGGVRLKSDFGTFVAPNISPDPHSGIGGWSIGDFANAMLAGVSPGGGHYYPAFPYASYARMTDVDLVDLFAFLKTLPSSGDVSEPHEIGLPFSIRRLVGGWKLMFLDTRPRIVLGDADPIIRRGQYLVEGPGHCGECHTPRNLLGGLRGGQWLAGANNPEGKGVIPNITPGGRDLSRWSAADIAYYLESGFTPEFDSVGGSMVEVQRNMANAKAADRQAIAAYLKAIPARADGF